MSHTPNNNLSKPKCRTEESESEQIQAAEKDHLNGEIQAKKSGEIQTKKSLTVPETITAPAALVPMPREEGLLLLQIYHRQTVLDPLLRLLIRIAPLLEIQPFQSERKPIL